MARIVERTVAGKKGYRSCLPGHPSSFAPARTRVGYEIDDTRLSHQKKKKGMSRGIGGAVPTRNGWIGAPRQEEMTGDEEVGRDGGNSKPEQYLDGCSWVPRRGEVTEEDGKGDSRIFIIGWGGGEGTWLLVRVTKYKADTTLKRDHARLRERAGAVLASGRAGTRPDWVPGAWVRDRDGRATTGVPPHHLATHLLTGRLQ